ncbi:uncharacterized protein IL334_001315 [Kwoniella shivajii]|uniref:Uncharacterized protein n=1 Tax=Kwoniella shivajii TaxID=564305 RepID=A0ABZ1CRR6_9TREE|nr:hypothetical protein IL334_001315 [Kwoniella shivajii]
MPDRLLQILAPPTRDQSNTANPSSAPETAESAWLLKETLREVVRANHSLADQNHSLRKENSYLTCIVAGATALTLATNFYWPGLWAECKQSLAKEQSMNEACPTETRYVRVALPQEQVAALNLGTAAATASVHSIDGQDFAEYRTDGLTLYVPKTCSDPSTATATNQ